MNKLKTPLNNIMKIMDIVIKKIEEGGVSATGEGPLVTKLLKKGFKLEDIDTAMQMVSVITSQVNPILDGNEREFHHDGQPQGIRHLHFSEAVRLRPAAQRLILKMVEEKVISQLHFEKTLEYIWRNDLRNVSASRLELLLMLNKPLSETHAETMEAIPISIDIH